MHNAIATTTVDLKAELRFNLMRVTKNLDSNQIDKLLSLANDLDCSSKPVYSRADSMLSTRERDVLVLLAHGYTRRDIGGSLGISANTAARHIANIYSKLDISSVAEATQYALANDII